MKPLFTIKQFDDAKVTTRLLCECYQCHKSFGVTKRGINYTLDTERHEKSQFCSINCKHLYRGKLKRFNCTNCNIEFTKTLSAIKKSKSGNHFCTKSCATTFNNKNKTHGTRRSNLEAGIETKLTNLYPELKIQFNDKDVIGSELDIYIPSLNVAFELNGIFHYEPIFGVNKLEQIQKNDQSKTKACINTKIDLCIIDTSQHTYVTPKTSKKYLDIIIKIINERLLTS